MAIGEKQIRAEEFGRVSDEMARAFSTAPLTPAMRECKYEAEADILQNFLESEDASGSKWAARKKPYPWPPLIKTGHMMRSATTEGESGHIENIGDREMTTGTSVFYAGFHQYGTKHMDARPFEEVSDAAVDRMEDHIVNYLQDAVFGGE